VKLYYESTHDSTTQACYIIILFCKVKLLENRKVRRKQSKKDEKLRLLFVESIEDESPSWIKFLKSLLNPLMDSLKHSWYSS